MDTTKWRRLAFVWIFSALALVILASSAIAQVRSGNQPADLILHNGTIWTAAEGHTHN